jgi:hypothetical protein
MNMMAPSGADTAHRLQCRLAALNRARLTPGLPDDAQPADVASSVLEESEFLEAARRRVKVAASAAPTDAKGFVDWFEGLARHGPGQGDSLFPWLATEASLPDMRWFLAQEIAGEAGFDDLTAMTLIGMPVQPKLALAANFWDEMGRGSPRGMHGPMLQALAQHLALELPLDDVVWQALALANTMAGLAAIRHYAFHSIGALGVIELTAPGRASHVAAGLRRLGVPGKFQHYFALHAVLDVKHSATWNAEVIAPLVAEDPRRATAIAEGALMRLECGAACFARYRAEFVGQDKEGWGRRAVPPKPPVCDEASSS